MRLLLILAVTAVLSAHECVDRPCSLAANFSADVQGEKDNRPETWGSAGAVVKKMTFRPPPGYRVRILRAYGDFLAWPIGEVQRGKFAGVLFGMQSTAPDGSSRADWAADNCFLYVQHATNGAPVRAPFDYKTKDGGLLEMNAVLVLKMSVWLNDTGLPIHMEPSFTLVYRYELAQ